MLKVLKRELNLSIIASVVYIIIGIVIINNPIETLDFVGKIVAIISIIYGIATVIINIMDLKEEDSLSFGIISIILGIMLLVFPGSLAVLISLEIGIWYITSSIMKMKFAIKLKNVKGINWVLILIGSIFTLLIGIAFIFVPLASAVALTTVSGILMIVNSVLDLIQTIFIKKNMSEIEKELATK